MPYVTKGFLSFLRLSPSSSFIFLRRSSQPRNFSQVHTLHAAIYVSFAFHVAVLSLLFIPSRFVFLAAFFYRFFFSARRAVSSTTVELLCDVEKRKSRSLLELRSEAMEMKRARFIYFPEFCRNALQSRMKRYVEIGALCCASCCSLKKKFREKGRRTHDCRVCALYEYVIS